MWHCMGRGFGFAVGIVLACCLVYVVVRCWQILTGPDPREQWNK